MIIKVRCILYACVTYKRACMLRCEELSNFTNTYILINAVTLTESVKKNVLSFSGVVTWSLDLPLMPAK